MWVGGWGFSLIFVCGCVSIVLCVILGSLGFWFFIFFCVCVVFCFGFFVLFFFCLVWFFWGVCVVVCVLLVFF